MQAEIFTNLKEAKLPEGAIKIYSANRCQVVKMRRELACLMSHSVEHDTHSALCSHSLEQDLQAHPLYARVEEAPGYMRMLERHSVVSPFVEAVIRQEVRNRKRKEMTAALQYRHFQKQWIQDNNLPKYKKNKKGELSLAAYALNDDDDMPQRKTRSRDAVRSEAEFQELLGAMEEEVKRKSVVAVVPSMLLTQQERMAYAFRNTNGHVPDPQQAEWSRCLVNTWTDEEQRIFIEKLADFASRPEKDGLRKNFRESFCFFVPFLFCPRLLGIVSFIFCTSSLPVCLVLLAWPHLCCLGWGGGNLCVCMLARTCAYEIIWVVWAVHAYACMDWSICMD